MPRTASYRANSVIYFEGDRDERVYILKSGKIILSTTDIETNEVTRNNVEIGEFFGVKAALGRYPREEDAMALFDSVVVILTVPEFEQLALNNPQIVIKMLKVFSNQLRRLHTKVQSMLNENKTNIDVEAGLFQCAEYYMSTQSYESATHALTRYLQYYPNYGHAQHARRYLQEANAALGHATQNLPPPPTPPQVQAAQSAQSVQAAQAAQAAQPPSPASAEATFSSAKHLFDIGKFSEALEQFRKLREQEQDDIQRQTIVLYLGRCHLEIEHFADAIRIFSQMLQEYSDIKDVDLILYYIGHSYHQLGNTQKAEAFLKRALMITQRGDSFKELVQQDLQQQEAGIS